MNTLPLRGGGQGGGPNLSWARHWGSPITPHPTLSHKGRGQEGGRLAENETAPSATAIFSPAGHPRRMIIGEQPAGSRRRRSGERSGWRSRIRKAVKGRVEGRAG